MIIRADIAVVAISVLWVLLEAAMACADRMLTPSQMLEKHPDHPKGLPFICHGGMWGDVFIVSPLVGVIVAMYGEQWDKTQVLTMLTIGMVLSIAMHGVYIMTPFPDSLAWRGGISMAGWMHVMYMSAAFTIIGLFYFCTSNVPPALLIIVSTLLTIHVAIGNHVVLGLLYEQYNWAWCPDDFISKPAPWITISATLVALASMTWWASGVAEAGVAVVVVFLFVGIIFDMAWNALIALWRAGG